MLKIEEEQFALVQCTVNGRRQQANVLPRRLLSDFLRYDLGLTGTHVGCEHGICGACTVRVNGLAVRSCLMLAVQVQGKSVDTIEGLATKDGVFSVLQQAFHEKFALQCGFCTPGFLMSLSQFLEDHQDPTEEDIREALSGNICRCTGYSEIVDAALLAASRLKKTVDESRIDSSQSGDAR